MSTFDKMLALVPGVKEGETLTFTYVPGKGTTLRVGDKDLGAFEGKGFADAVFSIWLGPQAAIRGPEEGDAGRLKNAPGQSLASGGTTW